MSGATRPDGAGVMPGHEAEHGRAARGWATAFTPHPRCSRRGAHESCAPVRREKLHRCAFLLRATRRYAVLLRWGTGPIRPCIGRSNLRFSPGPAFHRFASRSARKSGVRRPWRTRSARKMVRWTFFLFRLAPGRAFAARILAAHPLDLSLFPPHLPHGGRELSVAGVGARRDSHSAGDGDNRLTRPTLNTRARWFTWSSAWGRRWW